MIDDQGIHADPEKIRGIQDWFTPKSKKELQKFISEVIYHAQFLPHLSTALAPLSDLTSQEVFEWRPLHEEAFQQVQRLASRTIPLRPVNYSSPETIYIITDASNVGAEAWVGQGASPEKAYCNHPMIGGYNHYHLSPNGIPRGNQRWYGLVYFIQIAGIPRIRPRELLSSLEVLY